MRGEASPKSDLDVLVDFEDAKAGRQVGLLDFIALKQDLEALLGVPVDLGERSALEGGGKERDSAGGTADLISVRSHHDFSARSLSSLVSFDYGAHIRLSP